MGCLFSKKSLSTSAFGDRSAASTRVQHIRNSTSNGILRVRKSNETASDTEYDTITDHTNKPHQLRMKPPPLAPPPSPPSPITSQCQDITEPPTPEDERPALHVQYAEDLQPASPLQSVEISPVKESKNSSSDMTPDDKNSRSRETLDDKHRSRVSVSNVTLKPNMNGVRGAPMPLKDLSIEELDTEMDEFNRFRGTRYQSRKEERLNPVTTDILLPRRKEVQSVKLDIVNKTDNVANNTAKDNATTFSRRDTPYPNTNILKHEFKPKDVEIKEMSDNAPPDSNDEVPSIKLENEKLTIANLDVTNTRDEKVVTFDMSKHIETRDSRRKSDNIKDRPGTLTDIHVQTTHELDTENHSTTCQKTLYEQDLDKVRKSRKRKRTRNRQSDYTPRSVTIAFKDNDKNRFFERSLASLKGRPNSGTSTWTSGSKNSLGSTDTLHSFDMETNVEAKQDRYSYIHSGTTPVSFRNVSDENTEIIDLEDNGDLNDDSWLSEEPIQKEEQFDAWYGMKPYKVMPNAGRKDAGVVQAYTRGPSSSELRTKEKLMYSRFARRPQSESVLRNRGKPPIPPGTQLKKRPVSDTVRKYFTTDLDIH
ncbi:uncharacterized protein LOC123554930 [Mercenaria mercenaria]|uniref:uncharacterized protein LOC123554930 n=1 Tax=Mercenaria mercenaria TaxID=6596 RepID=UPI00234F2DEA|nr:uncharacterized protein LOC123554930 [Mercenaria mercenaria]XP_045201308.2 uncharacterized protein LOC123554930 [Mercenaria mercenaria]XP_045201309.2 uncharacterized protein LOC123554930 [Mercenaria mercenaria]XP_045201311.2 uncharacterized protein LOC123554930 [Mercenaria mercenaria]